MRGKTNFKRVIKADSKYGSLVIAKLINKIMNNGKKSVAQKIVYDAFDIILEKTKKDPLEVFDQAVKNVSPDVEVKSRRVGGANYQVPTYVSDDRKLTLAFRWLLDAAKNKAGKPMCQKLAFELIDAADNQGGAIKKKQDVYKMAQANRAFAHFAR
ncbi:MAG: 30S ribosomal protein S7 [Patescibacteria group bacterium]